MQNREIADIIEEMATLLELLGENQFKCRAYHNASRLISASPEDLAERARQGTLTDLRGIGKGLAPVVADLALTGTSPELAALRAAVPAGLVDMLRVQGLGPKTVRNLAEKLGINSLDKLRRAASEGRLSSFPGFGGKSIANLLANLAFLDRNRDHSLIRDAETAAEELSGRIAALTGVTSCSAAGSLRRRMPVIGDIDLVAAAAEKHHEGIMKGVRAFPEVARVVSAGPTKASLVLNSGMRCDIRIVPPASYPYALQYFTGSKAHNVAIRSKALSLGWSLNEYGLKTLQDGGVKKSSGPRRPSSGSGAPPTCGSEADIYEALGMEFIPPELREDAGELRAASDRSLPHLITLADLRGTFHCHTTYSDGRNTLGEMARAARDLGWEYLGIADHSRAAAYAGGLSAKDVARQIDEIRELNAKLAPFRIFAGTEVDILGDGALDWDDRTLALFDYVVASVHSGFRMTEEEATRRVIRALTNRHVTMLGHPTGRLLLEREGYPLDILRVIDAAADHGKIIEINANPRRLDLDWSHCRAARDRGVLIAVNPDAHSVAGLSDVRYGVGVARKGWLGPGDVLNTRSRDEVSAAFSGGRRS